MAGLNHKIPMTKEGYLQLQAELHHLVTVERPQIIEAIAEARSHGDLKENAEYHAAKEKQSFIEGRIRELEGKISHAHVINLSQIPRDGKVVFGVTVDLLNIDTEQQASYKIVGEDEVDLKLGKISLNSPIARALIGKFEEDTVEVETPKGLITYEIEQVRYDA